MISWRSVAKVLVAGVCGCVLPPKSAGESEASTTGTAGTTGAASTDEATATASVTATSTSGAGSGVETDSTSVASPTTGAQQGPCRDAVDCLVGCAATVLELPGCALECEKGLAIDEALIMFQLTECVATVCLQEMPECEDPGTSTGEPGTGSSSGGPVPEGDPCLDCILANVDDEQVGGICQELADRCV
jgi:hypothetical protein